MSLYKLISPYIFKFDPELMHNLAGFGLAYIAPLPLIQDCLASRYCVVDEALMMEIEGLRFYNPVGLAAGFDKNATMIKGLSTLGFGFLELGTMTHNAQQGNPKPRIFRYEQERSIRNAMGFNNHGSKQIAQKLVKCYPYRIPLGVNIGKNKLVSQEDSLKNYEQALRDLLQVGDYYVFNLSSPNTPNLRDLQNVSFVQELFTLARSHTSKPLFLKISPDMDVDSMLKIVEISIESGANGVIASNTTIDYSLLPGSEENGGISGEALRAKSKEILKILAQAFFGKTTLISVGGIQSAEEAYERIKLGASLVQVLSAMIFEGPALCRNINQGLLECLSRDGYSRLEQAVGQDIQKPARKQRKAPEGQDSGRRDSVYRGVIRTSSKKPTLVDKVKSKDTKAKSKS